MSVPLSNPSVGRTLLIVGGGLSVSVLFGPSFRDKMVWGLVRGQSGRLFFCHSSFWSWCDFRHWVFHSSSHLGSNELVGRQYINRLDVSPFHVISLWSAQVGCFVAAMG